MIFPAINHHFLGFPSLPPCHSSTMFHVSTASHDYPITPWSVSHCILMTYNCCAWNPIYSCSGWWLTYPSAKYESQLGLLFPIYGKITNVPSHQPVFVSDISISISVSISIYISILYRYISHDYPIIVQYSLVKSKKLHSPWFLQGLRGKHSLAIARDRLVHSQLGDLTN